jgi:hypothetical protein
LETSLDVDFRFEANDRAAIIGTDRARETFFQLTRPSKNSSA